MVFASSHLLPEMDQLAEDLVVIGRGRLIAAQPARDFVAAHSRRGSLEDAFLAATAEAAEFRGAAA